MENKEKNISEEALEKVSGGMPTGNRTHVDENGNEQKVPAPIKPNHVAGMDSQV